jgi:hypothetical protein
MNINEKLIGISGLIGSGKDSVGDILVNEYGYTRLSFAMVLKDMVAVLFDWDREMLEGKTPETRAQREVLDEWWSAKLGRDWSPRIALQVIGTDVMRNNFHEDIWLNTVENKIRKHERVVFTDCRFPNEIKFIEEKGDLWTVTRGPMPEWYRAAELYNSATDHGKDVLRNQGKDPNSLGIHESEWAWAGAQATHLIDNNSTLEALHSKVRSLAE